VNRQKHDQPPAIAPAWSGGVVPGPYTHDFAEAGYWCDPRYANTSGVRARPRASRARQAIAAGASTGVRYLIVARSDCGSNACTSTCDPLRLGTPMTGSSLSRYGTRTRPGRSGFT
jgi:hypothetical protein